MSNYYWIEKAMGASHGHLEVKALGEHFYCATVSWKNGHRNHERKKSGLFCPSLEAALASLDETLHEEVREELARRGFKEEKR